MKQQTPNGVREFRVDEASSGQRIDNFLFRSLKGVPKSRIYRILRKGEVRVNRGRVKPDYRLQPGDMIRVPPVRVSERPRAPRPHDQVIRRVEDAVLYEDSGFIILNKPAGLAVHGGSGLSYGVIEALRASRPKAPFLELAHRLDRDTSGCLVIAKKRSALRHFHELLRTNGVDKRYLALVRGAWTGGRREIRAPLRKNVLRSGERVVRVSPDGKPTLSIFEPVAIYNGEATLVQVRLVTGRTHQVRVHAAHSGHPIAGDEKYGDAEFNKAMEKKGLKRLFLHAGELSFPLPGTNAALTVQAPLDPALEAVLAELETIHES